METRTLHLLIVDDDELVLDLLTMLFNQRDDLTVAQAESGDAALEMIKAENYDLVLLDLRLPSGDEGLDVLAEIKRLKPKTGVIMMSAFGDIPKTVRAMKLGALDFLPKWEGFQHLASFKIDEFLRTEYLIADRERLIQTRYQEVRQTPGALTKGRALEEMVASMFASISGFIEIGRNVNTATEEIDLVFRNASRDANWERESQIILVECKNWHSQRVGKNEFVLFKEKIENRAGRCKLGFLVCTERFAETVEKEMLRSSKSNLLIVPIDGNDLRELVEAKNRSEVLRSFVDGALLK
jgi:FixJ family two-component response regulator